MPLADAKHIVLILSGKGGVGKSSVTTQLALSLTLAGKSVGILDLDLTGPSIPRLLGLEIAKITSGSTGQWTPVQLHSYHTLSPQDRPGSQATPNSSLDLPWLRKSPTVGPLYATSLAFLLPSRSSAVIWRGPKKTAMVRQFLSDVDWSMPPDTTCADSGSRHDRQQIDYLLIDTPPGTSDEHISLAEALLSSTTTDPSSTLLPVLSGAVVVTTPQAVSLADVRKELNFCKTVGIPVLGVVENMSGFACECCGTCADLFGTSRRRDNEGAELAGAEAMARDFAVPFLARLPIDLGWARVVEEGGWAWADSGGAAAAPPTASLVNRYRSCQLSAHFKELAESLVQRIECI